MRFKFRDGEHVDLWSMKNKV